MRGLVIPLDPVLFQAGPLALRWYGLMIGIGIVAGIWLVAREAERTGIGREHIYSLATWLVIGGIVGGRLYYVVQNDLGYFLAHPQDILATWQGGMAFYGIFLTCVPIGLWYARAHRLPFWTLTDTIVVGLPLGQAFGRVGNIVNGDILGYQTTSPIAVIYTNPSSFAPALNTPYVPANVYEMLLAIGIFLVIWFMRTRVHIPGMLFILYLELYSLTQFFIFFVRNNSVTLLGLKQAQLTAMVVVIALFPVASYLRQRYRLDQASREMAGEAEAAAPDPATAQAQLERSQAAPEP